MVKSARDIRYQLRGVSQSLTTVCEGHKKVASAAKAALKKAVETNDRLLSLVDKARDQGKQLIEKYDKLLTIAAATNDALKEDVARNERVSEAWRHKAILRDKHLQSQQALLTRARHLEAHVLHRSLGRPPMCGVRLPMINMAEWDYWRNMNWDPTDDERKEIEDLEQYFDDDPRFVDDNRWSCMNAFLDGEEIPHPPCTPVPSFVESSSSSGGFEIVPADATSRPTAISKT